MRKPFSLKSSRRIIFLERALIFNGLSMSKTKISPRHLPGLQHQLQASGFDMKKRAISGAHCDYSAGSDYSWNFGMTLLEVPSTLPKPKIKKRMHCCSCGDWHSGSKTFDAKYVEVACR